MQSNITHSTCWLAFCAARRRNPNEELELDSTLYWIWIGFLAGWHALKIEIEKI